jgi:hypothetical protein
VFVLFLAESTVPVSPFSLSFIHSFRKRQFLLCVHP